VKGIDIGRHRIDVGLGIGRDDPPDALAKFLRIESRQFACVDRIVHDQPHGAGIGGQPALQHHVTAPNDRQRHDGKPGLESKQEAAALEPADAPVATARALRKDDERQAARRQVRGPSKDLRSVGMPPIDQHVSRAPEVPAEKRDAPERLLRDDPQLKRQRPEEDRDVVDALVI
jgi:hypothetical protein